LVFGDMAQSTLYRGRWGESVAVRHLRSKGLLIVQRNWRCGHLEIDIVANDGGTVVFVEVKTRSLPSLCGGYGAASSNSKRRAMRRAVGAYVEQFCGEIPHWRYDVVEIFSPPRRYVAEQIFHFERVPLG
jgi:putative endonuclease